MKQLNWPWPIVAAMCLVFLGAGSASATTLCEEEKKACEGNHYPAGTELKAILAEGKKAILNGTWTNVECGSSAMTAKISKEGGAFEPVRATIQALTFGQCACAGGEVGNAQAVLWVNGALRFDYLEADDATTYSENTQVTYHCEPLGIQCIFGAPLEPRDVGKLIGGGTAMVAIETTLNHFTGMNDEGSFICGSTASWEATYEIWLPEPLHAAVS